MNATLYEQQRICLRCKEKNNFRECRKIKECIDVSESVLCEIETGPVQPLLPPEPGYAHNSTVLERALEMMEEKIK